MLEQILANMHIDPELLAELDDEQKQVLFFKMREEQIRRWKKWEAELTEDQKISPFTSSKPKRAVNLKVSFATEADGKPVVTVIDDDQIRDNAGSQHKKTDVVMEARKVDPVREPDTAPVTKGDSSTSNSAAAIIPDRTLPVRKSDHIEPHSVSATPAVSVADESSVFDSVASDQNELDWQNSLKKSKEHDEMRRVIARMIRMSLSEKPPMELIQPAPLSNENVKESQNVPPTTDDQSTKAAAGIKPQPATRPTWMKSSKPTCRNDIIAWFQNVEEKRNAMSDRGGNSVAVWFHGVITREEAENYLNGQRIGSFLVRVSERVWGYVVSYLGARTDQLHGVVVPQVKHYLVDAGTRGYRFFGADRLTHPSLSDLVKHHLKQPISLTGNEVLKYPVGQTRPIPDYSDLFSNCSQAEEISHL